MLSGTVPSLALFRRALSPAEHCLGQTDSALLSQFLFSLFKDDIWYYYICLKCTLWWVLLSLIAFCKVIFIISPAEITKTPLKIVWWLFTVHKCFVSNLVQVKKSTFYDGCQTFLGPQFQKSALFKKHFQRCWAEFPAHRVIRLWYQTLITPLPFLHHTEAKAKVVAAGWGTELFLSSAAGLCKEKD